MVVGCIVLRHDFVSYGVTYITCMVRHDTVVRTLWYGMMHLCVYYMYGIVLYRIPVCGMGDRRRDARHAWTDPPRLVQEAGIRAPTNKRTNKK